MLAIIGGTGYYSLLREGERIDIDTPYGGASVAVGKVGNKKAVFLPRHGYKHEIPPHRVNYRANIYAIKACKAKRIISINSAGSLSPKLPPGTIVLPGDLIDFTKTREYTFYDGKTVHIDLSEPYCSELRKIIASSAASAGIKLVKNAVYAATQGPRFETPAEIKMLRKLGANLVGMVGAPEAALAKELELCYASITSVTNYAAGISKKKLTIEEVKEIAERNSSAILKLIKTTIKNLPEERKCRCKEALAGAIL